MIYLQDDYDVVRDANDQESHLCNSLNAMQGLLMHPLYKNDQIAVFDANLIRDVVRYLERSQAVINYLQQNK